MNNNRSVFPILIALFIAISLLFSSCTPQPTSAVSKTPTRIPTPTSIPLPRLNLVPGEFYFRLNNRPSLIFSRNLGASQEGYYRLFMDWSVAGGTLIVRLPLDCFGVGLTSSGEIDEDWARQWERIFDRAAVKGLYIIPILTGWVQWDPSLPYSSWPSNQLNVDNGGPVEDPLELFQAGSETQELWLAWMETLVERWRGRSNILAWEIFSEVNCGTAHEADGINFINTAASRIRAVDPGRLITASRCESGTWPNFYAQADIDFVQVHPYPVTGQLDRNILFLVRQVLTTYHLPLMIGESGLHYVRPDFEEGKMTIAENAKRGVRHAIWAGIVSGAFNGRALWWEDSFGIYFPELSTPWLEQYSTMELPVVHFVQGVDFSGFTPLTSTSSPAVWGAAVGNGSLVLGWYRDASSEPPDWVVQTIPAGQTVTLTIPGSTANWQVDFYDTSTGTTILSSTSVPRKGSTVTVTLPAFQDDIAFKMMAEAETSVITPEVFGNTDTLAGTWSGTIISTTDGFSMQNELVIQPSCLPGHICGTVTSLTVGCYGDLYLKSIQDNIFTFVEQNMVPASCLSGGTETLQLLSDGLHFEFNLTAPGGTVYHSTGLLKQR